MATFIVTTTGTAPTVTLDTAETSPIGGNIVLTHPESRDIWLDLNSDDVARDVALQTALTAGEVSITVNGQAITTAGQLATVGSGFNQNLAQVLAEGNNSGANDIIVDVGQAIQIGAVTEKIYEAGTYMEFDADGGFEFNNLLKSYFSLGIDIKGDAVVYAQDLTGSNVAVLNASSLGLEFIKSGEFTLLVGKGTQTADRAILFPDADGTVALTSDIVTENLADTLVAGNTTGGTDIEVTSGDKVTFAGGVGAVEVERAGNQLQTTAPDGAFLQTTFGSSDNQGNGFSVFDSATGNTASMTATGNGGWSITQNYGVGSINFIAPPIVGGINITYPNTTGTLALASALGSYQLTSEKNNANGYAGLDGSSKINPSQLPSIAITDTFVVASQVAMLALTAQTGDIAIRTDLSQTFILQGTNPAVLGDWVVLQTPTDAVSSIFSRTGVVTAQSGDYTASQVTNAFDKTADDTDDITVGALNKFATASEKTKIGFITVTQAVDLDTIESDTATNNAKVTNATHTGDVTGATALTIANDAVTYAKMQNVSALSKLLGRGDSGAGDVQEITLGTGLTMTGTTLSAGSGLATKSGVVASGSFAGTPRIAAVTFSTAFADANYSVSVIGGDSRSWTIQSQTASGFTINTNSGSALSASVYWTAIKHGETA